MTTLDELREAANRAYVIVELDIRTQDDGGGPPRGWGWWHSNHRPWHHAPEGRRGWSEREALEDGLRVVKVVESDNNPPGEEPKMAKKKRKAKVTKVTTVSMSRHRKALAEITALKAMVAAKGEVISKLVAEKLPDPRPGHEWVLMPIRAAGNAPINPTSGTPTA